MVIDETGGFIMAGYILDLAIVTVLTVGLTAVMGSILDGIGETVFSRGKKTEFVDQADKVIAGWKSVGGKQK
jgi:large-conductance mechanosensitive channel